jgi:hypothetical protein
MEAERESQVFSKCPECGHDADDHAGGHGDGFDACLRTGCSCRGPFMESDLTACFRLVESIQRGLGNPELSGDDFSTIAKALRPLDDLVWKAESTSTFRQSMTCG